jgi:ketosteroid isomerase-like protein
MSRANVETISELLGAYERGGTEAALELVAPDFELTMPSIYPGPNRIFHGPKAARQALEEWIDSFEDFRAETEEMFDAGDKVIAVVRESGRMRGSTTRIDAPFTAVFAFDEHGRVARLDWFTDRAEALEAVGLSE